MLLFVYVFCQSDHLEQTVHVTCGSLILQANVTGVLLGVPTDSVRGVSVNFNFKGDGVIFYVAFVRVQDLCPGHVMTEAPVVLLAVEHVGDLPLELLPVPRTDQSQLRGGVTGPGAGL